VRWLVVGTLLAGGFIVQPVAIAEEEIAPVLPALEWEIKTLRAVIVVHPVDVRDAGDQTPDGVHIESKERLNDPGSTRDRAP
jgi:hypothetical protein